jgi:uncharacterized sulfatase
LLPVVLGRAGYYCSNNNKEDYNFAKPDRMWDDSSNKAHWRNRKPGQPFFAVFNTTVTHEGQIRKRPYKPKHDPSRAPVPPYHPDDPEVRLDWAQYYDRISEMDQFVGDRLQELEDAGLAESTIVFFFGDHGCGLPRGKRWLYQSGLHVPMIVHIPKAYSDKYQSIYRQGASSDRLVAFVDLLPTVLDLCGLPIPAEIHGRSFFVEDQSVSRYNFGFRDRMDERIDSSRAIRNDRYLYIRNFMPDRPQGAYLSYMFQTPTTNVWKRKFDDNELSDAQKVFWLPKAIEELYDLQADPHQIRNLAGDPRFEEHRRELADALKLKMLELGDTGSIPEDWIRHERKPDMQVAIEAAWKSGVATQEIEVLLGMLRSDQMIERYWGAVALRSSGTSLKDSRVSSLVRRLLTDPGLEVRTAVAESLGRYSDSAEERSQAIELLLDIAVQREASWGARMLALNALCDLGVNDLQAGRIRDAFKKGGKNWSRELPERYSDYLSRLVERLALR